MMKSVCSINNPIHRLKLRQALQGIFYLKMMLILLILICSDSKHIDDIEVAILSKQIDVFIRQSFKFFFINLRVFSYRRSTGNQLASLIKVLLHCCSTHSFLLPSLVAFWEVHY